MGKSHVVVACSVHSSFMEQASYEMVAKDASLFQRYTWETIIVDEGACACVLPVSDVTVSLVHFVYANTLCFV